MRSIIVLLLAALPAYLLGSVNGAIIASKLFYREDIRKFGSGNPGLTNFYRVYGTSGALMVVAVDVIKTVAPVLFGGWILGYYFSMPQVGRALCGLCVMLGHCFPVFYSFKGGKGVMAAGTFLLILDWRVAAVSWCTFIIVVVITRYVSLASLMGAVVFPPSVILFDIGGIYGFVIALLCSLLLTIRHKGNIQRLMRGEESKINLHRKA